MSEVQDAAAVTAVLDDCLPGMLGEEFAPHEAVHAALLDKHSLTWSRPPAGLSERVLLRVSLVRPERVRRWPVPLAASLLLVGGLSLLLVRLSHPTLAPQPVAPPSGPVVVVPVHAAPVVPPPDIDPGVLTRLPERSEPAFAASLERPFMGQVDAIAQDTQRGFHAVISRLPLRLSMDVLRAM